MRVGGGLIAGGETGARGPAAATTTKGGRADAVADEGEEPRRGYSLQHLIEARDRGPLGKGEVLSLLVPQPHAAGVAAAGARGDEVARPRHSRHAALVPSERLPGFRGEGERGFIRGAKEASL